MKITMLDYGITLDEGRGAGEDAPSVEDIKKWLTYPNVLARLGGDDKQWTDKKRTSLGGVDCIQETQISDKGPRTGFNQHLTR
jgi:hypothetical protein